MSDYQTVIACNQYCCWERMVEFAKSIYEIPRKLAKALMSKGQVVAKHSLRTTFVSLVVSPRSHLSQESFMD